MALTPKQVAVSVWYVIQARPSVDPQSELADYNCRTIANPSQADSHVEGFGGA